MMNFIFKKLTNNILLLIFLAIFIITLQQGEINRDGVLYLTQSQLFINGDWNKALSLYNWPFFSILIAIVHNVMDLTLQNAAYLINLAMFILASFFSKKYFFG